MGHKGHLCESIKEANLRAPGGLLTSLAEQLEAMRGHRHARLLSAADIVEGITAEDFADAVEMQFSRFKEALENRKVIHFAEIILLPRSVSTALFVDLGGPTSRVLFVFALLVFDVHPYRSLLLQEDVLKELRAQYNSTATKRADELARWRRIISQVEVADKFMRR